MTQGNKIQASLSNLLHHCRPALIVIGQPAPKNFSDETFVCNGISLYIFSIYLSLEEKKGLHSPTILSTILQDFSSMEQEFRKGYRIRELEKIFSNSPMWYPSQNSCSILEKIFSSSPMRYPSQNSCSVLKKIFLV